MSEKKREARMARAKKRAKTIFASGTFEYAELKLDYIARLIINDIVSEGQLFRDAYDNACHYFGLSSVERVGLQQSLLRHGWCSAYNQVGADADSFNFSNPYYIAPNDHNN